MRYTKRLRKPLFKVSPDGRSLRGIQKADPPLDQICVGIDPSLSGHAMAMLCNGEFVHAQGWTTKKGLQKSCPDTLNWMKVPPGRTETNSQARLNQLVQWTIENLSLLRSHPGVDLYVAIEGYAFDTRGRGLHEIHGLGEMIKQALWVKGIPFRIYDPPSIKLAWAGNGHADKDDMKQASLLHFGHYFDDEESAGENLADATLIAGLLHKELEVKAGRLKLENLTEEMRRVMLRTTKHIPVAIISREFITRNASTLPEPIMSDTSPLPLLEEVS